MVMHMLIVDEKDKQGLCACIVSTDFQVFELGEEAPDRVLRRVFLNLERLKQNGDEFAPKLEKKLRIIVSHRPWKNKFVFHSFGSPSLPVAVMCRLLEETARLPGFSGWFPI